MNAIRTVIVDDEIMARNRIRHLLLEESDIEVVGEAGSGPEALALIRSLRPELVFLDIQMPGLDGFQVLAALERECLPAVIFVTAYDQYALKAFAAHALDYLLKPFDNERFREALTHTRRLLRQGRAEKVDEALLSLYRTLQEEKAGKRKLAVREGDRILLLDPGEIEWLEADGKFVKLHIGAKVHAVRETLNHLEEKLPAGRFVRIHRSYIVRRDAVQMLEQWFHGDMMAVLKSGAKLVVSRSYRERLKEMFI